MDCVINKESWHGESSAFAGGMSIESCPSREWLQGTKFLYSGPRGHSPCCCNVLLAAWCWHKAKRNVKITAITKTVLSYRNTNDSLLIPLMLNKVSFQWVKTYRTWWWHQIGSTDSATKCEFHFTSAFLFSAWRYGNELLGRGWRVKSHPTQWAYSPS